MEKTKWNHKKKSASLVIALLLVLFVGTGTTLAYIIDVSTPLSNLFFPGEVACAVVANGDDGITDICVQNTGDTDVYVRATVVVTWKNATGIVMGKVPVLGTEYNISMQNKAQQANAWVKSPADGFYYWTSVVPAGSSTTPLIGSYSIISGKAPTGHTLSVEVIAEAIQAEPERAVEEAWGVTVADNGTISKP